MGSLSVFRGRRFGVVVAGLPVICVLGCATGTSNAAGIPLSEWAARHPGTKGNAPRIISNVDRGAEPGSQSDGVGAGKTSWDKLRADTLTPENLRLVAAGLTRLSGENVLWPGFDVLSGCVVIQTSRAQAPVSAALGGCRITIGDAGEDWLIRGDAFVAAKSWIGAATRYAYRSGRQMGFSNAEVLIVVLNDPESESLSAVSTTIGLTVHEAFHLFFQPERDMAVPFEMRTTPPVERMPSSYSTLGPRPYLERAYPKTAGVDQYLRAEQSALVAAMGLLEKGESLTSEPVQRSLRAFISSRSERHQLGNLNVSDEDSWERTEGLAVNLHRRAVRKLALPRNDVAELALSGRAEFEFTSYPYFYLLGALEAAILDDALGWETWPREIFPGASGDGATLFDLIKKLVRTSEGDRWPSDQNGRYRWF